MCKTVGVTMGVKTRGDCVRAIGNGASEYLQRDNLGSASVMDYRLVERRLPLSRQRGGVSKPDRQLRRRSVCNPKDGYPVRDYRNDR